MGFKYLDFLKLIVLVLLDSNKIVSKHLLSRHQSSTSSSGSMNLTPDNKIFEFDQLLEAINLSSESQKDAAVCVVKSK